MNDDGNIEEDDNVKHTAFRFINGNARLLAPKIDGLADCFEEKELDLAIITETWFQTGESHKIAVRDFDDRFSLDMMCRNRSMVAANGCQYGEVAIACRQRSLKLKGFPLHNPQDFEILAAHGGG